MDTRAAASRRRGRSWVARWAAVLAAPALLLGCGDDADTGLTDAEREIIATLSPLPDAPPLDPTNKYADDPAAAKLGQKFFFEKAYSGPLTVGNDGSNGAAGAAGEAGKLACSSCHSGPWLIDLRSSPNQTSLGAGWMARNAGTMVNVAYYPEHWYENDGLLDSIWGESIVDIEFDLGFNSSRLRLAHVIYDKYRDEYNAVFPPLDPALDPASAEAARFPADARPGSPEWEAMAPADQAHVTTVMVNFGKALHAYLRQLVSRDAPFDRFAAGDSGALGEAGLRGLRLFIGKAACVQCHSGPAFTDGKFYNNGLAPEGDKAVTPGADPTQWPLGGRSSAIGFVLGYEFNSSSIHSDDPGTGRLDGLQPDRPSELGAWRSRSLRQVAETAPFMRTGQLATLREAVEFYALGGDDSGFVGTKDEKMVKLNLSDAEIDDLVEFLKTLTGQPVPAALVEDTSNP